MISLILGFNMVTLISCTKNSAIQTDIHPTPVDTIEILIKGVEFDAFKTS
jgi:hypothetical protein